MSKNRTFFVGNRTKFARIHRFSALSVELCPMEGVMAASKRAQLYLTRSEIFAGAWRRFRDARGPKATPRQHPQYWAACLRMMWAAAKGDACGLMAFRDDARRAAGAKAPRRNWTARPARAHGELRLIRDLAA